MRMEQNSNSQNKNQEGFFQKNQNYIIAGVIVVLLIIYFATQKPANNDNTKEEQATEQESDQSADNKEDMEKSVSSEEKKMEDKQESIKPAETNKQAMTPAENKTETKQDAMVTSGNLSIAGKLMQSDNADRGNLMVMKGNTKYYISTKRDFGSLMDKDVTLQAEGDTKNYKFIGFSEGKGTLANNDSGMKVGGDPKMNDKGGSSETPMMTTEGQVNFSGTLKKSDNADKGNYVLETGKSKIYLKTGKDLSSLENKEVNASAKGTLQDFSGLTLTAKN